MGTNALNRIKCFRTYFVIFFIFCFIGLASLPVSAESTYPLPAGDILLEKQVLSEEREILFTEHQGKYFRREMIRESGSWQEAKVEAVKPRPTGLKHSVGKISPDRKLGQALEEKLLSAGYRLEALPPAVDYSISPDLPLVGEQWENSCVAWAAGYYLRTFQQAKDLDWTVKAAGANVDSHVFSPSFIYNSINEGVDHGATLEDAGNFLRDVGAATLEDFPYIPGDYRIQPDGEVIAGAYPHRIREWRTLFTEYDDAAYIIQKTKEYLNSGDLLVAGSRVGWKFWYPAEQPDGSFIITTETGVNSLHAYTIVGYDDTLPTPEGTGAFIILNSWGQAWGKGGLAYITYPAFTANVLQGCIYTDLENDLPVGEVSGLQGEALAPFRVSFTWNEAENAAGYLVLDESFREIARVTVNRYTEDLSAPGVVTRYVQAFNDISQSRHVSASVDTRDLTVIGLPVQIENAVRFNVTFSGEGRFGFAVRKADGATVYTVDDLTAVPGINELIWPGTALNGEAAADGDYQLVIFNCTSNQPVEIFSRPFSKVSGTREAEAAYCEKDGKVQSIWINLHPLVSGQIRVLLEQNGLKTALLENVLLLEGKELKLIIDKYIFDFNLLDWDAAGIILEIFNID